MGAARPVADTLHRAVSRTQYSQAGQARAGRPGGGRAACAIAQEVTSGAQALEGRLDVHHGVNVYRPYLGTLSALRTYVA
jgi:hypothetical protein